MDTETKFPSHPPAAEPPLPDEELLAEELADGDELLDLRLADGEPDDDDLPLHADDDGGESYEDHVHNDLEGPDREDLEQALAASGLLQLP